MAAESAGLALLESIGPDIEAVDQLLHGAVAELEEPLCTMLQQAIGGGKRLRAALVILAGGLFGAPLPPFRALAAAVEMLHAATLVHDDVVDQSSLRRGHETLHNRWPAGATVLAGDYLLARSTCWIAEHEQPRLLGVFAQAVCTICRGEIRQSLTVRGEHRDREEYYRSIEAKSAALFAAAAEMAGILAAAQEEEIAALRSYGREFGLAFQIVDDVLDITGDAGQLGKPAGSDLRQGLVTLPTLHYLAANHHDTLVQAVLSGQRDDECVRAAIEAIRSSGAIEASLDEARHHAHQAQEALSALPDCAARHTLHALAGYVVQRRS
jgi:geranylgeranyl pyrophosphate synthase